MLHEGKNAVDRRRVRAFYEAGAAVYDTTWAPSADVEALAYRELEERLEGWAAAAVRATRRFALECGCGTGHVAGRLIEAGVPVVGVDLVPAMARRASDRLRQPPAAMFCVAATEALPFRDALFGAVLDVRSFHHYPDPEAAAAEWARVLAPGGAMILADTVERDEDEGGFLTALAHASRPGTVGVFYKPHEIEYFLASVGLEVEQRSYYRLRRTFARMDETECRPAGVDPGGYRALVAAAPPEMRLAYEINEEGMTCRFLALMARKA